MNKYDETNNKTIDEDDTSASSSTLELDLPKVSTKEEHVEIPVKIPLILRNRIKIHDWNRIRRFCARYDTKYAIMDVFDRCLPSCCCSNPILFTFILGSIYAIAMAIFSAWYVEKKCGIEDDDSMALLCGSWKFLIISVYVLIPALAPTLYLMVTTLWEYQDLEVLPQLLFRSLYGYPGMSVHFIHCASAEAFCNTMRDLIRRSNEMEEALRKNDGKSRFRHSVYNADYSCNDEPESLDAEDIFYTVRLGRV